MMAVIRPSSKHIAGLLPNPNLCSMPKIADFKIFIPLLLCHSALKWGKIPSMQKYMCAAPCKYESCAMQKLDCKAYYKENIVICEIIFNWMHIILVCDREITEKFSE